MSVAFLAVFIGIVCYCYGLSTRINDPLSNYGFWVDNKEIWAFDYCNILRSGPNDVGESSRFECRNGNWVTKIWHNNYICAGEPDVVDTAPCVHPHCSCAENANTDNKLVEFKTYDDTTCSGLYFSTAAAVIDQCYEYNGKGYILQCTKHSIMRTQYEHTDCSDSDGKTTDITPTNTEYYCYSFTCATDSEQFENNASRINASSFAFTFTFIIILCFFQIQF
eukprot:409310_1